jgi:hypothetical protein
LLPSSFLPQVTRLRSITRTDALSVGPSFGK